MELEAKETSPFHVEVGDGRKIQKVLNLLIQDLGLGDTTGLELLFLFWRG